MLIDDDILMEQLSKNATTKMHDIVSTIQKEQNIMIRDIVITLSNISSRFSNFSPKSLFAISAKVVVNALSSPIALKTPI